jgi:hypothetical protein
MQLNGACLNPLVPGRLAELEKLRARLLALALRGRVAPRPLRRRQGVLLEAVTSVLESETGPLRVRDVHAAVEAVFRERVPFSSVNEALATHSTGPSARFRRVRYGTYEPAHPHR